ncbi:30S ribosomal protein S10 [candidate division WOR-3 bacterium]|nr:30S ribosomal protein S10 [candidate division WOR-3 bacterium]
MEKIRIKFKAYDHRLLDQAVREIVNTLRETGGEISGPIPLPTKRSLYTVLRSTNIDKKSREQFEIRIHKRLVEVKNPTRETMESLSSLNLPAGVDVAVKST